MSPEEALAEARKLWSADKHEEAVSVLAESAGNDAVALNELGYMQFKLDDLASAQANLDKAMKAADPEDDKLRAKIFYNLALTTEKRGDIDAARVWIDSALWLNKADAVREAKDRIHGGENAGSEVIGCDKISQARLGMPAVLELEQLDDHGEKLWQWKEGAKLPAGLPHWNGDLNGDGAKDYIVNHRECGNHGDCRFFVYGACAGGKHAILWSGYAQSVDPTDESDTVEGYEWRRLEVGYRDTSSEPAGQAYTRTSQFQDNSYSLAKP